MNPKVSVLVPVYNVSDFIERCVISLFSQTFKDIEYIFVNDCTPDDSIVKLKKVLLNFPDRQRSVTIIDHPVNKGLSVARTTALDAATGDFIMVVDSDDFIESDMVERLYQCAVNDNADMVVCDFYADSYKSAELSIDPVLSGCSFNFKKCIIGEVAPSLWNRLIKRDLYNLPQCRVPAGLNYYEDWHVVIRLYFFAQKVSKVDLPLYHYVNYNANSITRTKHEMHFQNAILFWTLVDQFLIDHSLFDQYKNDIAYPKVKSKVRLMIDTHSYHCRKKYSDIFQHEELMFVDKFNPGERLMLWFLRHKLFIAAQLFHCLLYAKHRVIPNIFHLISFK